ncbi:MAG TPA: UDP-N-acetylmuramoyl-L-alanine--D-glutamate ligase [Candidatus Cloacimonadota bacterium]|nr:UDP-N-acetylmuramoyl-L-alanine--D-glutamate ligase [Candidatus Cloacimonadota bacterium]HPT72710.1 UDP-N-acetylmuramoyl-L-alanine--D-glutamate ligase [Candidatus Cloacimonadota bacterium]
MFNKKINYGILGLARSGLAAAWKIRELGGNPFLSESKPVNEFPQSDILMEEFTCEFGGHTDKILDCDIIIVSPGIPLDTPIIQKANAKGIKLVSELEFGYTIKAPDSKIIAVTGSNGKSTTVSMIHHLLKAAGYNSLLAGNIGTAFTGFSIEKPGYDYIVLEISSFQLDLIDTFKPDIALLLNITPDHLNRYASFDHYALSKMRIFENQDANDYAIINADDPVIAKYEHMIHSRKIGFSMLKKADAYFHDGTLLFPKYHDEISIQDLQIRGPHNYANCLSSVLAAFIAGVDDQTINTSISGFKPLQHRLEFAGEINGIQFINDSKATNTDSVKYALQSYEHPVRIIMGGSDKGEDFAVLLPQLQKHAKKIYLIGATRPLMRTAYAGKMEIEEFDSFEKCIKKAYLDSEKGDVVLLSPACASYDMFNNFEHRGESFKKIVQDLKNEYESK